MEEGLIRQELPIQSIHQREETCTATVPIHLDTLTMPMQRRADLSLIADAKDTIRRWYNEDMEFYLRVLRQEGINLPWLKGYERFDDEWQLEGTPGEEIDNGFLVLNWRENGNVHNIRFNPVPVILVNQHDEYGKFYTPKSLTDGGRLIEIVYRNLKDPEFVTMSPEKMRRYGKETDIAKIDLSIGIAEVEANAFCSDYHQNMAKTLLLRDFAVFYLNQLLRASKENSTPKITLH